MTTTFGTNLTTTHSIGPRGVAPAVMNDVLGLLQYNQPITAGKNHQIEPCLTKHAQMCKYPDTLVNRLYGVNTMPLPATLLLQM